MSGLLLDRAAAPGSPATVPGFHADRPPRNKGPRYPADPSKVEEITAVMRIAGDNAHGPWLRGLIGSCRAPDCASTRRSLTEADLDPLRGALLVRRGTDGRRSRSRPDGHPRDGVETGVRRRLAPLQLRHARTPSSWRAKAYRWP